MITIEYRDVLAQVGTLLEYMASKRAQTTHEYYRQSICKHEYPAVIPLLENAVSWLSSILRPFGLIIQPGDGNFSVDGPAGSLDTHRLLLFRDALVHKTLTRWLTLTGSSDVSPWESKTEEILKILLFSLHRKSAPFRRPVPPI